MKSVRLIFRLLLLLLFIGLLGGAFYLWRYAEQKAMPILVPVNLDYEKLSMLPAARLGLKMEEFSFVAADALTVPALLVERAQEDYVSAELSLGSLSDELRVGLAKIDYVLIAVEWDHGMRSAFQLAEILSAAGLKCVLWEPRAINASRRFCTHGLRESADVPLLIDALEARSSKKNLRIVALGQGFGANLFLQAAALDTRVQGLIVIDAFTNLRASLKRTMDEGLLSLFYLWLIDRRVSSLADYECFDVAPVESVTRLGAHLPLLVISTQHNHAIANFDDSLQIYRRASTAEKTIWRLRKPDDMPGIKNEYLNFTVTGHITKQITLNVAIKSDNEAILLGIIRWMGLDLDASLSIPQSDSIIRPHFSQPLQLE